MKSNLQEAFPRYPYSFGSLRRTLMFLFKRHVGFVNIVLSTELVLAVVYVVFHYRLNAFWSKDFLLLARVSVWITAFCVSLMCCYWHLKLMYNFQLKLLYRQFQRCGTVVMMQLMVALFCLGILSTYSLLHRVRHASSVTHDANWMWSILLDSTVFVGVLQQFLSTTFICISLPVAKRWVGKMKVTTKLALLELLPWKLFIFLHYNFLFTLIEEALLSVELYKDNIHIVGIGFSVFYLLWLLFLSVYVGYELSQPCKYEGRQHGKKEMAGTLRKYLHYPPKSQVVTGLSPGHYALRYKGFQSIGGDKEMKTRIRTNAMAHKQYRVVFSQLD